MKDMKEFLDAMGKEKITAHHPVNPKYHPKVAPNSVVKKWFFDVQWTDCPIAVEDEVREIWRDYALGNDRYIWKTDLDDELYEEYPNVYMWLKHKGVPEGEEVIIHWWW